MNDENIADTNVSELSDRVTEVEKGLKARETSMFRALGTLVNDVVEYRSGRRDEFPVPAVIGVLGAYMRPRAILILGSFTAIFVAIAQIWLLNKQNDIISLQSQTEKLQVTLQVLSQVDPANDASTRLAAAQLVNLSAELDSSAADLLIGTRDIPVMVHSDRQDKSIPIAPLDVIGRTALVAMAPTLNHDQRFKTWLFTANDIESLLDGLAQVKELEQGQGYTSKKQALSSWKIYSSRRSMIWRPSIKLSSNSIKSKSVLITAKKVIHKL